MFPESVQPVPANHDATDEVAAEVVLAELCRARLIHSWHSEGDSFDVVVGRGTVGVSALDPVGVLRLATALRRDKVTIVSRGYPMGHRTTRYDLSDGRFIDRNDSRTDRYLDHFPYSVYVPGADPSGCATVDFAARTQTDALALAGLARIRGQCIRCQSLRPLHVTHWRPDPAIPCPGCGANALTPVMLLCRECQHPIRRTFGVWPYQSAWHHIDTRNSYCAATRGDAFSTNRQQARPA